MWEEGAHIYGTPGVPNNLITCNYEILKKFIHSFLNERIKYFHFINKLNEYPNNIIVVCLKINKMTKYDSLVRKGNDIGILRTL